MNEMGGKLGTAADAVRFLFGGNAVLTVVSQKTGTRYTFKVAELDEAKRKPGQGPLHFVSLLNGPDNLADYVFLGTIFDKTTYRHSRKSRVTEAAGSAIAFKWFFENVLRDQLRGIDVYHEGRCGRCGRALTVPESVVSGFGPECRDKLGIDTPDLRPVPPAGPEPAPRPRPTPQGDPATTLRADAGLPPVILPDLPLPGYVVVDPENIPERREEAQGRTESLYDALTQVSPQPQAAKPIRRCRKPTVTRLGSGLVECVVRDHRDPEVAAPRGPVGAWNPNPPDCRHGNDPDLCGACDAEKAVAR